MTMIGQGAKKIEVEDIGQGGNFSQKMNNTSALFNRKDTLRHF